MVLDFINICSERYGFMGNNVVGQPQAIQVPNYSGVNIQIFNPSVAAPGANIPASNVTSTNYTTPPQCSYPQNYYTQNFAPQPAAQTPKTEVKAIPAEGEDAAKTTQTPQSKKEKKEVVELTDDYIKTLETYLNDQDKEKRLMAAKEVLVRFEEDSSRKDDVALNALVNKMLQDPYQAVKLIAMSVLESRAASGNNKSMVLLSNMRNDKSNHGMDALQASNILLKMAGQKSTRDVEVSVPTENKKAN